MDSAPGPDAQARTVTGIASVEATAWDRLVPADHPFLSHAFLTAFEASRSACDQTGWQPFHLLVEEAGRLIAAAPLYVKGHSYGEYVFDHGWAEGYRRAGGRYYPKLLCAVPFTPVPGPRLLAESDRARAMLVESLVEVTHRLGLSSLHVTFCTEAEAEELGRAGLLLRQGIQFHWTNQGYADFQGWLDSLKSAKRKMVRKERDQVRAAGVTLEAVHGEALDRRLLDEFFPFYLATVDKRWGNAYLSRDFFRRLAAPGLRDRVVLMVARHEGRMVGAALNVRGTETLYGRQWGCIEEFRFLHFEACYYQAIEFAIRHGLKRVEAGAQGVHKLHRGYAPIWTHSAHLIVDPGFRAAVARFLASERRAQEDEMTELLANLPYRHTDCAL